MLRKKQDATVAPNWWDDPRLVAAKAQLHKVECELAEGAERAHRKATQLRQANAAIDTLLQEQVMRGVVTEEDIDRLRSQRTDLEREFKAAQESAGQTRATRDALKSAIAQLERTLKTEAKRVAIAASKPVVEQLTRKMREVAALNAQLGAIVANVECVDPLRPVPQFELTEGSGFLWHYLRDMEGIDWDGFEGQVIVG